MGCVQASGISEADKKAIEESLRLDRFLTEQSNTEGRIVKLLLLGTGESGKSTIFKQMQILYQEGFSDLEKNTFKHVIRRNVVESMQALIQGVDRFGFKWYNEESEQIAEAMLGIDPFTSDFWQQEVIKYVNHLWKNEKAIKKAFNRRSQLQLLDSAPYLFDNVERIGQPDYVPTADDILRARLRTSGIVERMFKIEGVDFKFIDVGGQRNERRKWIHCFEGVTAVIFVAAISEYDQVLYEDEKKNRMHEALEVFENVVNSRFFVNSVFILFMNKIDLFKEKLPRVPLSDWFPEYKGPNDDFEQASEFIKGLFLSRVQNKRTVFPYLTCATDTQNVKRVFEAAKYSILQGNLRDLGSELA